ncbi:MAG TPA: hypothetical protein VJM32_01740 [Candidatus Saccharimonadales bacterium]|nr:hypothetical protein [Candidatus Saccharimonadales bacterium]
MMSLAAAVISAVITGLLYLTEMVTHGGALFGIFLLVWLVVWIIIRVAKGSGLDDLFSIFD